MDRGAWQATVHGAQRVGHDGATNVHISTVSPDPRLPHLSLRHDGPVESGTREAEDISGFSGEVGLGGAFSWGLGGMEDFSGSWWVYLQWGGSISHTFTTDWPDLPLWNGFQEYPRPQCPCPGVRSALQSCWYISSNWELGVGQAWGHQGKSSGISRHRQLLATLGLRLRGPLGPLMRPTSPSAAPLTPSPPGLNAPGQAQLRVSGAGA